jgi:hypothetical protein
MAADNTPSVPWNSSSGSIASTGITDSGTLGRSVLQAETPATGRAALGCAPSDHNHDATYSAVGHTHAATQAFPVGSIFIAVVATNPGTLLGYGTWTAFGAGRVLVGLDAAQTEFDTVRETGGAKTHQLTTAEMPSHTHVQDAHSHTVPVGATDDTAAPFDRADAGTNASGANATTATGTATAVNQNTGGGGAHNNLQPYIVAYMWERTA